jgi:hypothetical protein
MERSFGLALKCYGGFVLLADHPPGEHQNGKTRLWSLGPDCAAVSHGSLPAAYNLGQMLIAQGQGNDPIDTVFTRCSEALTAYCAQNLVGESVGFIFAGFDAERRQKFFGWVWDQNAPRTQHFDLPIVYSSVNPIGVYLTAKLYSFDLTEELISRLGLYVLLQTRTILPFPMDEFAEVGWLRSSRGLEIKHQDYVRERLELIQRKGEELRFRCQQLLAKEYQ